MTRARDAADQINRVNSSAANATAITVDASENVLVGKTSAGYNVDGFEARQNGETYVSRSGTPMAINRNSSDGTLLNFYKSGTTVGSIFSGHGGSQVGIGTNTTGITFNPATRSMMPANPSSTNPQLDATLDIGFSSVRWKDLYLSGGVYLGGTGAANKLDDYETGTWTPAFVNAPAGTVSSLAGQYVKVGKLVTVYMQVGGSSLNLTSYARVQGLPFSASSSNATGTYILGGIAHRNHGWTTLASGSDQWYFSASGSDSEASMAASITYKTN